MKCSQCKEKLAEYIEGNLPAEVDEEIRVHLLTCESCREAYEEEIVEYEAFKAALRDRGDEKEENLLCLGSLYLVGEIKELAATMF